MKIEVTKKILESLNPSEIERLEMAHWRYMHLIDIIDDPNPEDVDQAKEEKIEKLMASCLHLQYLTLKTQFNL